jgi:hypothetical protein
MSETDNAQRARIGRAIDRETERRMAARGYTPPVAERETATQRTQEQRPSMAYSRDWTAEQVWIEKIIDQKTDILMKGAVADLLVSLIVKLRRAWKADLDALRADLAGNTAEAAAMAALKAGLGEEIRTEIAKYLAPLQQRSAEPAEPLLELPAPGWVGHA